MDPLMRILGGRCRVLVARLGIAGRGVSRPPRPRRGQRPWRPSATVVATGLVMLGLAASLWSGQLPPPREIHADRVVVNKSARSLTLYSGLMPLKTYRVALGFNPVGPKTREGDGRTPEGRYAIDYRNPKSRYYLALHVSYPDAGDAARAARLGVPPGGAIMIHGTGSEFGWGGRYHWRTDWTDGCIAVTNSEMLEIWYAVRDGTPVEIRP